MTTWSVVIEDGTAPATLDDTATLDDAAKLDDAAAEVADKPKDQAKAEGRPERTGRFERTARALLASVTAVLVVGVGATLVPAAAPAPEPSFSDVARASALAEARTLLSDVERLPAAAAAAKLLDLHARALQRPGDADAKSAPSSAAPSASASASSTPSPSNPPASPTANSPTTAAIVTRLAESGSRRLADATASDGGTARLLAAVGTAQLLEAKELAASAGLPVPPFPSQAAPSQAAVTGSGGQTGSALPANGTGNSSGSGISCLAAAGAEPAGADMAGADMAGALSAVGRSEAEAVYLYQVALTRLDPAAGKAAAGMLAVHQGNVRQAEELSRLNCVPVPPREAGYRLPGTLAARPGAALGSLEAGMLGVYGDLIALGPNEVRSWAVEELALAAQRAKAWGVDPGFLPGISIQASELPAG